MSYQWTAAFIGLGIGVAILWLVRKSHLHGPYAIWWIAVASGVVALSLFPNQLDQVSQWLGVAYSPMLAVVVALGVLLIKVLTMDLERTRQEGVLRRLTQRLAILEAEMHESASQSARDEGAEQDTGGTAHGPARRVKP